MKTSTQGYKRNSPDKGAKQLRIPSNQITMKGVDFPVIGTDNLGVTKLMHPNMNYTFPGSYVDETPIAKDGGWIKGAVNPAHKGFCTPMTKSTCTPHRKAFAKRAKAHFKQDGGEIIETPTARFQKTMAAMPTVQQSMIISGKDYSKSSERVRDPRKPINWGETAVGALFAIDALIPERDKIKDPVVRPLETYNEHSYGTGSQAIAQDGKQLPPIYTPNPNDKRLQAYKDSLTLYKDRREYRLPDEFPKPVQPVIYQREGTLYPNGTNTPNSRGQQLVKELTPIYKTPVPRKPILISAQNTPDMSVGNTRPTAEAPNFEQSKWDTSKPSPYNFTYPTGPYNKQKTINFPDEKSYKEFIKSQKNVSSQSSGRGATATGNLSEYKSGGKIPKNVKIHGEKMTTKQRKFFQDICDMDNGGELPTVYEQGQTVDIDDNEIKRLVAAGYQLKIK